VLFNSYVFIFVFLPVTLAVFFLLGKSGRRGPALAWLFGASLFFYAWWNPADLPFLLLSIALNYSTALALRRMQRERSRHWLRLRHRRQPAVLELAPYRRGANLNALLAARSVPQRSLPLAISFFTFQQIVFLVDAYRGRRTRTGPLRYATGVAFFPHLLAGPIVQYSQLMPQFTRRRILRPQAMMIAAGVTVFTFGLFKKVILADSFAQFVPVPFGAVAAGYNLTLVEAWAAALSYTFQIYFDFSGYSDMAIGLALLFGITLPVNFNSPYKAGSIIEFWRRWHMTLSAFLRDYLYVPLGGGRSGAARRYLNLMITMLLGGLWHGAAWTFVIWGGIHGTYLLVNHAWRSSRDRWPRAESEREARAPSKVPGAAHAARLLTFTAVVVAWVFFRADTLDTAVRVLRAMAGGYGVSLPRAWLAPLAARWGGALPDWIGVGGMGTLGGWRQLAWLSAALVIVWAFPNTQETMARRWEPSARWAVIVAVLAFAAIMGLTRASTFIYFNF
jgi:D-alanyl-lipoteichoic acid acyltransferase DltB (MBOAT superfamily)